MLGRRNEGDTTIETRVLRSARLRCDRAEGILPMAASSHLPGAGKRNTFVISGANETITEPSTGYSGGNTSSANVSVYGVAQISHYLGELLDQDPFLSDLWVAGEVTNLSRSQAGHIFFTLSEPMPGSKSTGGTLRCVFFSRYNSGVTVAMGESVLVHGRVSLYADRGDLQLYVDALQPEGTGVLEAEFRRLFERLKGDGLFDPGRKRQLPRYPRTVGVVTSAAGAVWHDIQSVMARRWPMAGLLLAPTAVQGDGAAVSIAGAIEELNALAANFDDIDLDVIIVARGGGSADDLWAFNDERVARAIFASETPVVSAVGHETDTTLVDYVADVSAPTPSAAAELIVPDEREDRRRISALLAASEYVLLGQVEKVRGQLTSLSERMEHRSPDLASKRVQLEGYLSRADAISIQRLTQEHALLTSTGGRLETLSPLATLARGYAIVQDAGGGSMVRAKDLAAGQQVSLRFQDGIVAAEITGRGDSDGKK